jgi:hypothetical protein
MARKGFSFSLWLKLKSKGLSPWLGRQLSPGKWLFIVGCYNSGTTLLHTMLSRHTAIGSMPNEGQFYTDQLPRGAEFGIPRLWALKPELFHWTESYHNADVDRLIKQWSWFMNDSSRPVLMDKTIANAARTRWLQANFPGSHFVLMFRDPLAVCEGIRRKEGHSLEDAIGQWCVSNRILLEDSTHLQHAIRVRYEDLVENPVEIVNRITDMLGLDTLNAKVFSSQFHIHEQTGLIRNMNAESHTRLTESEMMQIRSRCTDLMYELGYS